ncbi:hypothetical protein [Pseudomonas syringae pv. coryli]|uniref:hypothetical protein n=1 Tax=Pseudomonas syringae pv. coryli TaxID=317659 RepID=UPI003D2AF656
MKSENAVSGVVERVGFVGYAADVHYMTLLLEGLSQIFLVFFNGNNPVSNVASLTQLGDQVEFKADQFGRVEAKNFINKTVSSRLQE